MEQESLRHLIRNKLADGRLPQNSIPRVWGGAGNGKTRDACEELIIKTQFDPTASDALPKHGPGE